MRLRHFVIATLLPIVLLLAGCTAPTSSQSAPDAPAAQQPVAVQPAPAAPAATPVAQASQAMETASAPKAADELGRSCNTDSDCAVKDVGNCCGAYPMCVNKNTKTDPAAVRAQCAKESMASICGFQEVSGCQCVKGQCENIASGAVAM
jgi:hypothetical protein